MQITKTLSKFQATVRLGLILLAGIALSWLLTQGDLFVWLKVPDSVSPYLVWLPTIIGLTITQTVIKISPQQKSWSRVMIIGVLFLFIIRYLLWRSLFTLNFSSPLNGLFSLLLYGMELLLIFSFGFQLILLLKVKTRHHEADKFSLAVIEGKYTPSVAIFIPTYDEPLSILKRTIVGCQALDYPHKEIYVLDDGHRAELKTLAVELGCVYLAPTNNSYAKAGNLNNALNNSTSDLIVVFDADFVPNTNFLTRTVGFFQNPQLALLQTYQSFYNADPIARNLGLEKELPQDVEIFSRQYQLLRDSIETALCYGSSFVVRRSHLEKIGGFVTESLSEDYFTGIRLASQGYQVHYFSESLSAGLAAENMNHHIRQRLRWARGTLQAFFISANPLKASRLTWLQKLAHLEGISQWFSSLFRAIFLFIPLAYIVLGVVPLRATMDEWIYFFMPFYLTQVFTFAWLNYYSRSALISDIYNIIQCFPVSLTIIQTLLNPFKRGFNVTPKGTLSNHYRYNWDLGLPLIIVFFINLFVLIYGFKQDFDPELDSKILGGIQLTEVWSIYNLVIIVLSIFVMLDVPKPNFYEWFNVRKPALLFHEGATHSCLITKICEAGAEINFKSTLAVNTFLKLELVEIGLKLQCKITRVNSQKLTVIFEPLSLTEYRQLVELLFCRPGIWEKKRTPGELQSIWLIIKSLSRPMLPKVIRMRTDASTNLLKDG